MAKPPRDWIDKIFICLEQFYGGRWSTLLSKNIPTELYKDVWHSALEGVSYEQIKKALLLLKRSAHHPKARPLNHIEFTMLALIK